MLTPLAPLSLLTLLACAAKGQHLPTITLEVGGVSVVAEVADDDAERQMGLMHREALERDHGMLFVYPDERLRGFWMKNTITPLSIAYISATGRIVHTAEMKPLDETVVPSNYPAMYALEMSQGWFLSHNISAGAAVTGLPGPSAE